jgi:hypothetical protein
MMSVAPKRRFDAFMIGPPSHDGGFIEYREFSDLTKDAEEMSVLGVQVVSCGSGKLVNLANHQ